MFGYHVKTFFKLYSHEKAPRAVHSSRDNESTELFRDEDSLFHWISPSSFNMIQESESVEISR